MAAYASATSALLQEEASNIPSHGTHFSPRQMASLTALSHTFFPSIHYESADDVIQAFHRLSASKSGIPEEVAQIICSSSKPQLLWIINWLLRFLSSGLGTFLLFGKASLSCQFPYLQSFTSMPCPKREVLVVNQWLHSSGTLFPLLFRLFKNQTLYTAYTKVDEHLRNPTWEAIGYVGPDPKTLECSEKAPKPLEAHVIDVEETDAISVVASLQKAGFLAIEDVSHLRTAMGKGTTKLVAGKTLGIKTDVVVVGSGAGGGVAAAVLAQAGFKVIVVEKGKYYARDSLSLLEGLSFQKMFEGGTIGASKDGSVSILAGSVVGGGTVVNWSASFRTPDHVLEEWEKKHNLPLFTSEHYQKAMDAVCQRIGVQGEVKNENVQNTILRKGCQELGYHVETVSRNAGPDHSCGWCGFGCWNGKKQATSETWLVDAVSAGAVILSGCKAKAILHQENKNQTSGKKRKAVGVVASMGECDLFIQSAITIVSCGSLQTPPLLLRSGLENPNIGKNLHLHPVTLFWGYFPPEEEGSEILPKGTAYEGGIVTTVCKEVASLNPPGYGCILQTPSLHPGLFSCLIPWLSGFDHKEKMLRFARTMGVFALARDVGSGKVNIDGEVDYTLGEIDEENLKEGGERALRVLVAAGAEEVGSYHMDGDKLRVKGAGKEEVEDFLKRVRSKGLGKLAVPICTAHQLSSCRMGTDAGNSAVDPSGETWEVEGLFVADASVMPTALGVNPMVTIESIAYCVAHSAVNYMKRTY